LGNWPAKAARLQPAGKYFSRNLWGGMQRRRQPEAARRGQPERHGPVMKFGAEMLVAAQAKSMLK